MRPLTQAVALKQLAWHLEQLLTLIKREIHHHQGVLAGIMTCNHNRTADHHDYHQRMLCLLADFKGYAKDDLKDTNLLIWDLPYDDWTDDQHQTPQHT